MYPYSEHLTRTTIDDRLRNSARRRQIRDLMTQDMDERSGWVARILNFRISARQAGTNPAQ
ncbi:MAG: hypothetical protein V3R84_09570 [Acidimicrobiia bacterium]